MRLLIGALRVCLQQGVYLATAKVGFERTDPETKKRDEENSASPEDQGTTLRGGLFRDHAIVSASSLQLVCPCARLTPSPLCPVL